MGIFYLMVYRKFLHPKSIVNSVVYHNALRTATANPAVKKVLGDEITMMNCNGKIYPLLSNCNFDLVLFGSKAKGKVSVQAEYVNKNSQWNI